MYARRVKNSLKEIESPRQDLTFRQLKIYYEENGMKLNDNFAKNLNLLTNPNLKKILKNKAINELVYR